MAGKADIGHFLLERLLVSYKIEHETVNMHSMTSGGRTAGTRGGGTHLVVADIGLTIIT